MIRAALAFVCAAATVAAQPPPPAWAADAVWYQIFPERFANGDPTNDPTWASLDAPERVPEASWRVSEWTADWYARADWERALGPDFYDDGVQLRRYGGDLQGILDRAPYLDSLGVTAVYLNPVFHAASLHKYDATSFHHVDPHFGPDPAGDLALIASETPGDPATWVWTSADRLFLRLVEALHARGIRVVVDGVFNHTGTRFWAFEDVRERGRASPYYGWYDVLAWDDPATPADEFDWRGWWGFKPLPEFADTADGADLHPAVKAHVFAITRRWMDPDGDGDPSDGVDGWRLDVSNEVPPGFWRDWTTHVRALNPDAITVAEEWGPGAPFLAETGLASLMNYHGLAIPLDAFAFDGAMSGRTFADAVVERFAAYPAETGPALMAVLASHDTPRLASQIVNGGLGPYDDGAGVPDSPDVSVRAPTAEERRLQRAVVALQMALPGAPHVYYGDEAGMWGPDDPDDRKPMVWPGLAFAPETRHPRGLPRPADPVGFDDDLFDFYRSAIALRKTDPVLRRGTLAVAAASQDAVAFERSFDGERRVVGMNPGPRPAVLRLSPGVRWQVAFASDGAAWAAPTPDGNGEWVLPARTTIVLRADRP